MVLVVAVYWSYPETELSDYPRAGIGGLEVVVIECFGKFVPVRLLGLG